jgi:hypothetical protein
MYALDQVILSAAKNLGNKAAWAIARPFASLRVTPLAKERVAPVMNSLG